MFLTLNANSVFHNCPDRDPLQIACSKLDCPDCDVGAFEVSGLLKMQAAGILALHIIYQLQLEDRHQLLCKDHGLVWPRSVKWDTFMAQDQGKFKLAHFIKWVKFHIYTFIANFL